jgi:hypothetical protein
VVVVTQGLFFSGEGAGIGRLKPQNTPDCSLTQSRQYFEAGFSRLRSTHTMTGIFEGPSKKT